MKTLHLTLKKKWFDMIKSGEKKEEYREIKSYWVNRLTWHEYHKDINCIESLKDAILKDSESNYSDGVFMSGVFDAIEFKNGYGKNAPKILIEFKGITYGPAKPEWSDNWPGKVFIIKLGEIIS